jgi:hypothetical protein
MIAKLKDDKGIDWNTFENGKKYGRVIRKVDTEMEKDLPNGRHVEFVRSIWTPVDAIDLKENGEWLRELIPGYYED